MSKIKLKIFNVCTSADLELAINSYAEEKNLEFVSFMPANPDNFSVVVCAFKCKSETLKNN